MDDLKRSDDLTSQLGLPAGPAARRAAELVETQFKTRWEQACRAYCWGPVSAVALPKADLRRLLLEFFSHGMDHRSAVLRRLEELLPDRSAERLDGLGS